MIEFFNSLSFSNCMFYMFSGVIILSAVAVISVRNPVYSVLFLIVTFINAAGLFILLGAEFIAFLMVIVYVGAVAVLFLFVVMMLNIRNRPLCTINRQLKYTAIFISGIVGIEIFFLTRNWGKFSGKECINRVVENETVSNTEMIGQVLYTEYFYPFQIAGLILFVAMIGSIVLTLRKRAGVRRQVTSKQLYRTKENSLILTSPKIGEGVQ